MEYRQDIEHLVFPAEVDARGRLRGVRQHVAVREHYALRQPFGSRCEQDRRPVIGLATDQRLFGIEQTADLVAQGNASANVLEIDDCYLALDCCYKLCELALLDEGSGAENGVDLRGLAGGKDVGG